jgi:hypothetical protein
MLSTCGILSAFLGGYLYTNKAISWLYQAEEPVRAALSVTPKQLIAGPCTAKV